MGLVYYVYYRWCDPNPKCGLLAQVCFHQQQIETLEMRRKLCYKPVTTHKQKQKILVSKTLPVLDSVLTCQKSVCGNHPATLGLAFFILRSVNSKLRLQTMQRIQRQLPSTLTEKKRNLNMLMHTYIHTPGGHGRIVLFFFLAPNQPLYPSVYVLLWQNMSG